MVFDYRNNREEVLKSGVIAEDYNRVIAKEKVIEGYTFRNFTSLKFDKTKKINKCIFENCKNLDFFNAWIEDCTFNQIGDSINLEIDGVEELLPDRKTKGDFACFIALFLALEQR